MFRAKKIKIFLLFFFLSIFIYFFFQYIKKKQFEPVSGTNDQINYSNSNIIKDIAYTSKDEKGNIYKIFAKKGEIDLTNTDIIFLTEVNALIEMVGASKIKISSDFGKYNINNYNTIFSKNVIVDYTDNKIKGEYLDFSMLKNLLMMSRNIIYTNKENTLYADTIEINTKTKDIQISMYEKNKKIKVINKN